MKWHLLIIVCIAMLIQEDSSAQECSPPIVNSFIQQGSDSVEVKWLDTNPSEVSESYTLRYRLANETNETTRDGLTSNGVLLTNLISGQDYELDIRAHCGNEVSEWNGPYRFSSGINNNEPCGINLTIKDNGCPSRTLFPISVTGINSGEILTSIDLTIEHPWPADLSITLVSPSGIEIPLVQHKGTFTKDFGTPGSSQCQNPTSFSDLACTTLENGITDLKQSFRPLSPLSAVNAENNGTWQLSICDRASGDVGILKGAHLSFIESPCQVPTLTHLSSIAATSISVGWNQPSLCNRIVLNVGERGFPIGNGTLTYVECIEDQFTLLDLEPDTEYDLYIATECEPGFLSPFSCSFPFKTLCTSPIATESFDSPDTCSILCQTECLLNSNLWRNKENDGSEWIPRSGKTPTEFTGPESDIHRLGSYLYIENQPDVCEANLEAILESTCVFVIEDDNQCDLEFSYHLYGQDIASLQLSVIEGNNPPSEIWRIDGDQTNAWWTTTIDLSDFANKIITLQFTAITSTSVFGDIGLDQITFIGLDPFDDGLLYFEDKDGDGYGNPEVSAYGCNLESIGYTQLDGDCDDDDASINPNGLEIPCNGIDENCNGNSDDLTLSTLDYQIVELLPSICGGQSTGSISLQPNNGNEPYEVDWSTGASGQILNQIPAGMYTATVTDAVGCTLITNPIIVPNVDEVSYSVSQLSQPHCSEIQDGQITLLTNCESDCSITWSNGLTGNTITGLDAGDYFAVISSQGCLTVTDTITLNYTIAPLAGIQLIRPVTCHDGEDGRIVANSITGSPLSYQWSNGSQASSLNSLKAGFYNLTITDPESECSQVIRDIEVTQPDPIDYVFDEVGNNLCPGDQNAAIQISVIGGNPPYSYNWNTNDFTDDIFQLSSGDYRASITDSKGCGIITETVTIQEPSLINIEIDRIANTTCTGSHDGEIDIIASGGTGELSYLWSTTQDNTSQQIDNLQSGLYSVTVVDEIGCKTTLRNIPVQSEGLILNSDLIISDEIQCSGDSTGLLNVTMADGIAPFNYNWSNGIIHESTEFTDQLDSLGEGNYMVTITDAIGCTSESNSITLVNPDQLTYLIDAVNAVSCYRGNDGSISLSTQGGTDSLQLTWNHGDSLSTIENLTPGSYEVTLTDGNGCTIVSNPIQITEPDSLQLFNQVVAQTSEELGTYQAIATGGITPYTMTLDGVSIPFSEMPYELTAGTYEVVLNDNNGCTLTDTIVVDLISGLESPLTSEEVIIYPNPSNSRIDVKPNSQVVSISLYSLNGNRVKSVYQEWIEVSMLSDGCYFCKVTTENGVIFKRVTVLH